MQYFYVDKTSSTSADTLLAVGFAVLLNHVLQGIHKPAKGITICDSGPYYKIQLPISIAVNDLQDLKPFSSLVLPLVTDKQESQQEAKGIKLDGFDYQAEQEKSRIYFKNMPMQYRTPEAHLRQEFQQLVDPTRPSPKLGHYQAISQMKIASSFNELASRWLAVETAQRECISLLLALFHQPNNDLSAALVAWQKIVNEYKLEAKASVTQLQIVNPTTGKGSNRSKSSTLSEGNPDNFWLLELLKFVGFMHAAAPYVIRGSKDRKTYVLQPSIIELSSLSHMMRTFRAVCWSSTAIKLDIMASLRFTQVFITFREQALRGQSKDDFMDEDQLYSIAQGFEVGFYKDMGSAYATMNVSTINLPQWLPPISTLKDAEAAQIILKEHLTIIQQLRNNKGEEGSEEYELLRFYRDFLSGRNLKNFWLFTTAYSGYLISQREYEKDPKRHIRQFTTHGLEHLLSMSNTTGRKLTKITSNPGFKRIAYAIRQATVRAQFRRSQQRDRTYEVRYGLGQELMREARYEKKFIATLSSFLHEYNAETAREEEKLANRLANKSLTSEDRRAYKLRGSVSYADIDEIVTLIDEFDSETVCSLLVAYGYASDPRREASENGDLPSAVQEVSDTIDETYQQLEQ